MPSHSEEHNRSRLVSHPNEDTDEKTMCRARQLQLMCSVNFRLAIFSVLFFGINVVCGILSWMKIAPILRVQLATVGCLFFMVVKICTLMFSPKWAMGGFQGQWFLGLLVILALSMSFVSTMLVLLNDKYFDFPVHVLLFTNEVSYLSFDFAIVAMSPGSFLPQWIVQFIQQQGEDDFDRWVKSWKKWIYIFMISLPLVGWQFYEYMRLWQSNVQQTDPEKYQIGLQPIIFAAYAFQIVSSIITFSFAFDNKNRAEECLVEIVAVTVTA
jgi:hypothetical protein